MALPAFFVAAVARENFVAGVGAAAGSLIGLMFTDFIFSWGHRKPMPALPPIAFGTLLGFFVAILLQKYV